jgi:hypothetical protein
VLFDESKRQGGCRDKGDLIVNKQVPSSAVLEDFDLHCKISSETWSEANPKWTEGPQKGHEYTCCGAIS